VQKRVPPDFNRKAIVIVTAERLWQARTILVPRIHFSRVREAAHLRCWVIPQIVIEATAGIGVDAINTRGGEIQIRDRWHESRIDGEYSRTSEIPHVAATIFATGQSVAFEKVVE
jgi:hypothetical protein